MKILKYPYLNFNLNPLRILIFKMLTSIQNRMFKNHINQYQRLIMISRQLVKMNGEKNKKYMVKFMVIFSQE